MSSIKYWNGRQVEEFEMYEIKVPTQVTLSETDLLNTMIDQHNGVRSWFSGCIVEARFISEDDASNFELELKAYTDQQQWLETLSDDDAAELGLIL